jgi:hypothetical protein
MTTISLCNSHKNAFEYAKALCSDTECNKPTENGEGKQCKFTSIPACMKYAAIDLALGMFSKDLFPVPGSKVGHSVLSWTVPTVLITKICMLSKAYTGT